MDNKKNNESIHEVLKRYPTTNKPPFFINRYKKPTNNNSFRNRNKIALFLSMRKTKIWKKFLLLCFLSLTLSSCISRLARPQITGVVVGYDKKPIMGCRVGETVTDKNGHFILPEKRYNAFF